MLVDLGDGDDASSGKQILMKQDPQRRKKNKRNLPRAISSSSEFSDGDDFSSCLISSRTSELDGTNDVDRSSECSRGGEEQKSGSTSPKEPPYGTPDYWDFKRMQLKKMMVEKNNPSLDKDEIQKTPRKHLQLRKAHANSEFLRLSLDRDIYILVGGRSRACLVSKSTASFNMDISVACKDLNIVPSLLRMSKGQEKTNTFLFRVPSGCMPGKKSLSVTVHGYGLEKKTFQVEGITVTRPIKEIRLSDGPCYIPFGKKKNGLRIKFDTAVVNDPLKINLESDQCIVSPNVFIIQPGSLTCGPFSIESNGSVDQKSERVVINVILSGCTQNSQVNLLEQPTILQIHKIFFQRPTYPNRLPVFDETDQSSDSMSILSSCRGTSMSPTPRSESSVKSFVFSNDGGLAELKSVLKNLQEKKNKLSVMGSYKRRERNRIKRRIITLKERIAQLEQEQQLEDFSEIIKKTEKRDPQNNPPPQIIRKQIFKRDPALKSLHSIKKEKEQENFFRGKKRSQSVSSMYSEDSSLTSNTASSPSYVRRPSKPPLPSRDKDSLVKLTPEVFSEMMELPINKWNTQHVCCWLQSLGMKYRKYIHIFFEKNITGENLSSKRLNLKELGVYSSMHRNKILEEINFLKKKSTVQTVIHGDPANNNKQQKDNVHINENVKNNKNTIKEKKNNDLFKIKFLLTNDKINNEIIKLRESLLRFKGKGKDKKQKRLKCIETIQAYEMMLLLEKKENKKMSPTTTKENEIKKKLKKSSSSSGTQKNSQQQVKKEKSKKLLEIQKIEEEKKKFSEGGGNRFQTFDNNKEIIVRRNSFNKRNSFEKRAAFKANKFFQDNDNSSERFSDLESIRSFTESEFGSETSVTLSEIDDTEEFESRLFNHINDDISQETHSIVHKHEFDMSRSQTNDDSITFEDEDESSDDECSSDLSNVQEISYGTPGYWAFKRRQLQEMALKRKQRDRLQVEEKKEKKQKKKREKAGLSELSNQLHQRYCTLEIQRKQLVGGHQKKFRIKITKQMQTIQKRINQLHTAKRMRAQRLAEQRKMKNENEEKKSTFSCVDKKSISEKKSFHPHTDVQTTKIMPSNSRRSSTNSRRSSTNSTTGYASALYWNNRYKMTKKPEEWYEGFVQLEPILKNHLQTTHLILDLGCGDSQMQDHLREQGYEVMSCDISDVILKRLASENPKREMLVTDAFKLPFTNCSFDIVLDKGTLDAVSCDEKRDLVPFFNEIHRVLRPTGKYICVTPWNPSKRTPLLNLASWNVSHQVIPMSLKYLATQKFNQLTDHPRFGRNKDTLMQTSLAKAAELLENIDLEKEIAKPPGVSCVLHCYFCTKERKSSRRFDQKPSLPRQRTITRI